VLLLLDAGCLCFDATSALTGVVLLLLEDFDGCKVVSLLLLLAEGAIVFEFDCCAGLLRGIIAPMNKSERSNYFADQIKLVNPSTLEEGHVQDASKHLKYELFDHQCCEFAFRKVYAFSIGKFVHIRRRALEL